MALPAQHLLSTFSQRLNQLPASRKMGLAAALAAAIALVVGLFLWSRGPDYRVLFSNLSEKDAGAVTASLQQMNVPYKTEAGGTLLVPGDQVYDLRFRLAAQGLPKGGAVGFELLDAGKLGMTQFQEQVAYQRGLEGELARTIQSLSPVQSARVHLAIPKPSVFIRDRQSPSASVLVNMHPGRVLDAGQVQSIVHLVSSSVSELSPGNVTVVDQAGNLLTTRKEAGAMQGLDAGQLDYVRQMEGYFASRIEAIVSPIVGQGNVKAEVRADLDFSESEATSETYKPNPAPETQAIRSQQSVEDVNAGGGQAQGVPGAFSNQPPGPATAPLTAPANANAGVATPAGQSGAGGSSRRESTVNFELDKTIRHVKDPVGRIKRLSVAVVVNYRAALPGPEGAPGKPTPLTAQELEQIQNLVKEATGYNQERGDTVNVVNAAFTETKTEMDIALWKDPDNVAMLKSLLKNLLVFGLAFYLVFGVLRPLLRDLMKPLEGGTARANADATAGAWQEDAQGSGHGRDESYVLTLGKVKEFAKSHPQATAEIIREWMAKE
ncbi:MAG TPA: flagellar basal-body MS-ring/collar protein FliF [Thiobacillaceae bacterium]|nr:flagellar basal-body MS-ring/collar protein FliF [Thiobacillaceae bacterium]HNU64013.1 flagellar basal-body MS-ring/collar protein FliF [Thiobacillaceae bacterium]